MPQASKPVTELKNIGPNSGQWLADIGIHTEEELRHNGVIQTYLSLKAANPRGINLMMLWALQGALMDINCMRMPEDIKEHLKELLAIAESEET